MRILVADDHGELYDGLQETLRRERPEDEIVFAVDGIGAEAELRRAEGSPFDILILDEQMGGGERDGSALLRRLADQQLGRPLAIAYITSFFNLMPAERIATAGTPIWLFIDRSSGPGADWQNALLRFIALVARKRGEGASYAPSVVFGEEFLNLIGREVTRILETQQAGFLSLDQQRQIGSLVRSYFTTLQLREDWDTEDLLDISVFLVEGLCRLFGLPIGIVQVVRRFVSVEDVLYSIPKYRDHFLHQVKVFLLGFCVLNALNRTGSFAETTLGGSDGVKLWFLASAFHDIGYPFEKMESWLHVFSQGMFGDPDGSSRDQPVLPPAFHWGVLFGRRYHWYHLDRMVDRIMDTFRVGDDPRFRANLQRSLGPMITEAPDHAIYGSLILQNFLRLQLRDDQVDAVAVAVALHSFPASRAVRVGVGQQLSFELAPLPFLLAFCDIAQEWGRPTGSGSEAAGKTGGFQALFDGCRLPESPGEPVCLELRYPRAFSPEDVLEWRNQVFMRQLLPLPGIWRSQGARFRIEYFCGPERSRRIRLDELTL